jgi:colicin import membrane protein
LHLFLAIVVVIASIQITHRDQKIASSTPPSASIQAQLMSSSQLNEIEHDASARQSYQEDRAAPTQKWIPEPVAQEERYTPPPVPNTTTPAPPLPEKRPTPTQKATQDSRLAQQSLDRKIAEDHAAEQQRIREERNIQQAAQARQEARVRQEQQARQEQRIKQQRIEKEQQRAAQQRLEKLNQLEHQKALAQQQKDAQTKRAQLEKQKALEEQQRDAQAKLDQLAAKQKQEAATKMLQSYASNSLASSIASQSRSEAQTAQDLSMRDQFLALIRQEITHNWNNPFRGQGQNYQVTLAITVNDTGTVESVQIQQSSGNSIFDRQVIQAIWRSSPLPMPKDPDVRRQWFQHMTLQFNNN